jgi:hypothetical protein
MLNPNTDEQSLAYRFASLALPDDATDCGAWQWHGGDDWRRPFTVREWEVVGVWVSVAGEQNHHGSVTRWVHVSGEDQCNPTDRSRLISALIDAGSLLDSLQVDHAL